MKNYKSTVLILLIISGLTILFFLAPPIQSGDLKLRDLLFQIRGPQDLSHSDIMIVEIGQQADSEIPYKFPWPVSVYAKLVENLNKAGAKAIAFDIMFDQPDLYEASNDSMFAAAVEKVGNVLFIGGFRRDAERRVGGYEIVQETPVFPRSALMQATPYEVGFVDMRRDQDGFIRTYPLQLNFRGDPYYSLALQMVPLVIDSAAVKYTNTPEYYEVAGRRIPKTENSRMLINYYGANRSFDYISLDRVVDDQFFKTTTELLAFDVNEFDDPDFGLLQRGIFQDKIVLVGATMPELQDYHQVPFPNSSGEFTMAGVEIHAHVLQSILDNRFISELSARKNLLISFIILLVTFGLTHRFVGWLGLISALGLVFGWFFLALTVFINYSLFLPVLPVFLSVLFGYTGSTFQNVLWEIHQKKKIQAMFSSYVSPDLVQKLVKDEASLSLGGSSEHLTVMFSDIENFSSLSEKFEATELVALMNEYLQHVSNHINDQNGTLDKYIGDAVMAFFGAPISRVNHPVDACRAALSIGNNWVHRGVSGKDILLKTRIGMNTGQMVVGNMGSERRFNYTVMGFPVNIAAQCEVACKYFGVYRIVTEATKMEADIEGEFSFRKLGKISAKGRKDHVFIYELIGYSSKADVGIIRVIHQFEEALRLFYNRDFEKAKEEFEHLIKAEESHIGHTSNKNPSLVYRDLCEKYIKETPMESWEGTVET